MIRSCQDHWKILSRLCKIFSRSFKDLAYITERSCQDHWKILPRLLKDLAKIVERSCQDLTKNMQLLAWSYRILSKILHDLTKDLAKIMLRSCHDFTKILSRSYQGFQPGCIPQKIHCRVFPWLRERNYVLIACWWGPRLFIWENQS